MCVRESSRQRWGGHERKNETVRPYACTLHKASHPYLFVSLQLLNEGPLVEQGVQTFLCVVVAQVLKGRAVFALGQPGVLKAWGVHDEQRAQGILAGFQGPAANRAKRIGMHTWTHKH